MFIATSSFSSKSSPSFKTGSGAFKICGMYSLGRSGVHERERERVRPATLSGGGVRKDAVEEEEEVRAQCVCVTICAYVGVEMSAGLLYSLTEEDDDKVRWRRG